MILSYQYCKCTYPLTQQLKGNEFTLHLEEYIHTNKHSHSLLQHGLQQQNWKPMPIYGDQINTLGQFQQYNTFLFLKRMNQSFILILKKKVTVSCSVVSDSSRPHGLQPTRLPCPQGALQAGTQPRQRQASEKPPERTLLSTLSGWVLMGNQSPPRRKAVSAASQLYTQHSAFSSPPCEL